MSLLKDSTKSVSFVRGRSMAVSFDVSKSRWRRKHMSMSKSLARAEGMSESLLTDMYSVVPVCELN